ncbi:hypothetical protein AAH101_10465 [Phocaeicola vulgatus]|uniref:hypothetical protein n=1 Tax=Phocaeicola vulgatus TaxID=821 RepID=UPI0039B37C9D
MTDPPLDGICPKIRLTNGECEQNGCALPFQSCGKEMKEDCPSTQTQDTMEVWRMTAIGKEARSPLAKGKPTKGDKLV